MEKVKELPVLEEYKEKFFFDDSLFKSGVQLPLPEETNLDDEVTEVSTRLLEIHAKTGTLLYAVGSRLVCLNRQGILKLVEEVREKKSQKSRPNLSSFVKSGLAMTVSFDSTLVPKQDDRILGIKLNQISPDESLLSVELKNSIIVVSLNQILKTPTPQVSYTINLPDGFVDYAFIQSDIVVLTKSGQFTTYNQANPKAKDAVAYLNNSGAKTQKSSPECIRISTVESKGSNLQVSIHVLEGFSTKWKLEANVPLKMTTGELLRYNIFMPRRSKSAIIPCVLKNDQCFEISFLVVESKAGKYTLKSTAETPYVDFDNMTYDDIPDSFEFGFTEISEHGLCFITSTHASKLMLMRVDLDGQLLRPDSESDSAPVLPTTPDSYDEPILKGASIMMFDVSLPELATSKLQTTGKSLSELPLRDDEGAPISIPIPPTLVTMNSNYIASLRPLSDVRSEHRTGKGKCILVVPDEIKFTSNSKVVQESKTMQKKPSGSLLPPMTQQPTQAPAGAQKTNSPFTNPSLQPQASGAKPAGPIETPKTGSMFGALKPGEQPQVNPKTSILNDSTKPVEATSSGKSAAPPIPSTPANPSTRATEAGVEKQEAKLTIPEVMDKLRTETKAQKTDPLWAKLEMALVGLDAKIRKYGSENSTTVSGSSSKAAILAPERSQKVLVPKLSVVQLPAQESAEALLKDARASVADLRLPFSKHKTLKRIFSLVAEKEKRVQTIKSPACVDTIQAENNALFAQLEKIEHEVALAERRLRTFSSLLREELGKLGMANGAAPDSLMKGHSGGFMSQRGRAPQYNSLFGPKKGVINSGGPILNEITFSFTPKSTGKPKLPSYTSAPQTRPTDEPLQVPLRLGTQNQIQKQPLEKVEAFLRDYFAVKSAEYDELLRELHKAQRQRENFMLANGAIKRLTQFERTVRPESERYPGTESCVAKSRGTTFDLRDLSGDDDLDGSEDEFLIQQKYTGVARPHDQGSRIPVASEALELYIGKRRRTGDKGSEGFRFEETAKFWESLRRAEVHLEYCLNLSLRKELQARSMNQRASQAIESMTLPSGVPVSQTNIKTEAPAKDAPKAPAATSGLSSSKPAEPAKPSATASMFGSQAAPTNLAQIDTSVKPPAPSTIPKNPLAADLGGIFSNKPAATQAPVSIGSKAPTSKSDEAQPSLAESVVLNSTKPADPLAKFTAGQTTEPSTNPTNPGSAFEKPKADPLSGFKQPTPAGSIFAKDSNPVQATPVKPAQAPVSTEPEKKPLFGSQPAVPGQGLFSKFGTNAGGDKSDKEIAQDPNTVSPPRKSAVSNTSFLNPGEPTANQDETQAKRKQSTLPALSDPRVPKQTMDMAQIQEQDEESDIPPFNKTISQIGSSDAGNPVKKISGQTMFSQKSSQEPGNQGDSKGLFGLTSTQSAGGIGAGSKLFDSQVLPNAPVQATPASTVPPLSTGFAPAGGLFSSLGMPPTAAATTTPNPTPKSMFGTTTGAAGAQGSSIFGTSGTPSGNLTGALFGTSAPAKPATPGLNFTGGASGNIFAGDTAKASGMGASAFGQSANLGALKKESTPAMGSGGFGGMGSSGFGSGASQGFSVPAGLTGNPTSGGSLFGTAAGTGWLSATGASATPGATGTSGLPSMGGTFGQLRG